MALRTITLPQELAFQDAVRELTAGNCLGIQPYSLYANKSRDNEYLVLSKKEGIGVLCWNGEARDFAIPAYHYHEKWYMVIVDHRSLVL